MPAHRYKEEISLSTMLAAKRSVGVTPEMNLRECVTHMPLASTNKAAHSGLENQRRSQQESKTGVSVAPKKGLVSFKFYFQEMDSRRIQIVNAEMNTAELLTKSFHTGNNKCYALFIEKKLITLKMCIFIPTILNVHNSLLQSSVTTRTND